MMMVGYVMVETEGYILQVSLPIMSKVRPLMGRQAISDPAARPVPSEASNVLAKLI
jgi:hypothetical protein